MSTFSGPIVEITISIGQESIEAVESWLADQIETIRNAPGVVALHVLAPDNQTSNRTDDKAPATTVRVINSVLESEDDIERFLAGSSNHLLQSANEHFVGQVETELRILRQTEVTEELAPPTTCLNCGAILSGQYCGDCGQRYKTRLISIWELVKDAFGDLFELDSRLWRTLIPLVMRPGKLTRDYLRGQRVRFMPPFRTYLLLSIVFFLIAFFDPKEELGILFDADLPSTEENLESTSNAADVRREVLEGLTEEGIIVPAPQADQADNEATDDDPLSDNCDLEGYEFDSTSVWLMSRMSKDRLEAACRRIIADNGKAFARAVRDNAPAALFVLLPLMALVLKVLYPLSKRYYVEHLLFVVHFHAFVFLILTMQIVLSRLTSLLGLPNGIADVSAFVIMLYIPIYLYKALRRVYEQRRSASILKFLLLAFSYFVGFSFIILFTALFTAITI